MSTTVRIDRERLAALERAVTRVVGGARPDGAAGRLVTQDALDALWAALEHLREPAMAWPRALAPADVERLRRTRQTIMRGRRFATSSDELLDAARAARDSGR